jgi:glycosyltransferase involved in cell wall biosynthesis
MPKSLIIINNEKCSNFQDNYFCENIEISSLTKSLSRYFEIILLVRRGVIKPVHKISIKNIKTFRSFYFFSFFLLNFLFKKKKEAIYLLISITPFTFLSYIFISFFSNKIFLYLRSHGDEEFKYILGSSFGYLYRVLLFIMSKKSKLICVNKKILNNKKFFLVHPSQLDMNWMKKKRLGINKNKLKLLYFGRIKKEKGVYSLINLYININFNFSNILNIVGPGDAIQSKNHNIIVKPPLFRRRDIIKLYDSNDIFILPSYTEGCPQVLIESLSRLKPVIIFEEIQHIKKNYQGVFVARRTSEGLKKTILYIRKNYNNIQSKMKLNRLQTHQDFIKSFIKIFQPNIKNY